MCVCFCLHSSYSQVRKSTLNPNANEFKPRFNTQVSALRCTEPHILDTTSWQRRSLTFWLCVSVFLRVPQPKPANTPTPPRPQGQPSPSIVVQQPPAVYGQPVCFPQMYPLTPVSPGVQVRRPLARRSPPASHRLGTRIAAFIKTDN